MFFNSFYRTECIELLIGTRNKQSIIEKSAPIPDQLYAPSVIDRGILLILWSQPWGPIGTHTDGLQLVKRGNCRQSLSARMCNASRVEEEGSSSNVADVNQRSIGTFISCALLTLASNVRHPKLEGMLKVRLEASQVRSLEIISPLITHRRSLIAQAKLRVRTSRFRTLLYLTILTTDRWRHTLRNAVNFGRSILPLLKC